LRLSRRPARYRVSPVVPRPDAPLSGSCLCGGVHYQITRRFERAGYCRCSPCRKLTGAPSALNGRVAREAFRLLEGEELLGVYRPPGSRLAAIFCKTCGSSLFRGEWA
jgi:hypothetical protein